MFERAKGGLMTERNEPVYRYDDRQSYGADVTGSDRCANDDMIVLPAIRRPDSAARKAAARRGWDAKEKSAATDNVKAGDPGPKNSQGNSQKDAGANKDDGAGFLPEYHSKTDGLRELLSSIEPMQDDYQHGPFHQQSISALPSIEENMHLPHSRPGIPGTPDLPVGPAGWGRKLVNSLLTITILFFAGLLYSHFTSPTGINWTVLQAESRKTYKKVAVFLTPAPKPAPIQTASVAPDNATRPNASVAPAGANAARMESGARLDTTAATARLKTPKAHRAARRRNTPKTPRLNELMLTPQQLEDEILALEGKMEFESRLSAIERPRRANHSMGHSMGRSMSGDTIRRTAVDENDLLTPLGINIDPEMEKRIFMRASSYLKQRDISSARMILQYAASLGSGVSALALAETFDPVYLQRVNLPDVQGDPKAARKWYRAAARLGVKEAAHRLASLPSASSPR